MEQERRQKKQERRQKTEQKILGALESILINQGFEGIGINAVAKQAGVSKSLIYRYFGGLPQLIHAFMSQHDYWGRLEACGGLEPGVADDLDSGERLFRMLAGQIHALRDQPEVQEIRRMELMERNDLTDRLADEREQASLDFVRNLRKPPGVDVPAVSGLLLAGAIFLVLRAKTARMFFGIDLHSDAGWQRIEDALRFMIENSLGCASGGSGADHRCDGVRASEEGETCDPDGTVARTGKGDAEKPPRGHGAPDPTRSARLARRGED